MYSIGALYSFESSTSGHGEKPENYTCVLKGIKEGYRQEFHHGSVDGRVSADDKLLKKIFNESLPVKSGVSLGDVVAIVSEDYGVSIEVISAAWVWVPVW